MKSTLVELSDRVAAAIVEVCPMPADQVDAQLRRAQDERFGDYQSNCAMGLGKRLGIAPRALADRIAGALTIADLCDPPEVAGPGFINLRLRAEYVAARLAEIPPAPAAGTDRLGLAPAESPQVVVVDMSSPNLAKELHVGHLRSTVIGDCVSRLLEFAGHTVHRVNHVGDWGTQFGMLLAYLRRTQPSVLERPEALRLDNLEEFYIAAKALFDADPAFAAESRETVVALQRGDADVRAVWQAFCTESLRHCHEVYDRLGVRLTDRGESFYRDRLAEVIDAFHSAGLAQVSDGATCVFLDGFTTRDGGPLPMMIRKSDGGYNYATTDLAALRHRVHELGADRIVYVVGVPQKQHLEMLFAAARKVGWAPDAFTLTHLAFGSMLGPDGTPFKTRTGGTVKLRDLLDEAVERARRVVENDAESGGRRADFDAVTIDRIARTVALGAVKYYDLSHAMGSDYRFDWNTMLALEGNTAPYLLYAYARIRSIGRKAGIQFDALSRETAITLSHPSELRLAKKLLDLGDVLKHVTVELRPNLLTDYLYDLSKAFSTFYDRQHGVRVIDAEPPALRLSRLRLCDLTARTLKLGLHLLGIDTVEQM
ncbi:MAG: arginine--tRNA ligase [Phycisphaerales bacterium]|nr:arginine--tRNA ligase [Phycisphaerales bacterium]